MANNDPNAVLNNPSAFPQCEYRDGNVTAPFDEAYPNSAGMTLRDYFAAKALAGYIVADPKRASRDNARDSYADADAMLIERERHPAKAESEATNVGS